MPEIPYYTSRAPGPASSGLEPSPPTFAGGDPIQQGFNNLASGLLQKAHYDAQQAQMDQISAASQHLGAVVNEADQLWSEVQDSQRQNPADPRERQRTFQQALNNKIQSHLDSPDLADPAARKYFTTHIPAMLQTRLQAVHTETQGQLQRWNNVRTNDQLTAYADNAINEPAKRSQAEKQAKALIDVTSMLNPNYDGPKEWSTWQENVSLQRGRKLIGADTQAFVDAELTGQLDQFWSDRGMHLEHFSSQANREMSTYAHELNTLRIATNTADQAHVDKNIKDSQVAYKNDYLSRHITHQDTQTGQQLPAEPVDKILADLGTTKSKGLLGPEWDSVHAFYVALKHHNDSGEGEVPSIEDQNKILTGIYTGRYDTPMKVMQATTGLNFNGKWRDHMLEKFNTERGHVDTDIQRRVNHAIKVIDDTFPLVGGGLIDPADASQYRTAAHTQFFLWLEGTKERGPQTLRNADIIGTAQVVADEGYAHMYKQVVDIIPRTRESLIYKTPEEIDTKFKAGKITEHQATSFLQQIGQLNRLEEIAASRPKAGSSKGRGEAFK